MSLKTEIENRMTLSERGLWLQCESMKREIADLTDKNDSLIALAKQGDR